MHQKTLSAISNPVRLRLITCLGNGSKSVEELIANCHLSQSAVSQHLCKLRQAGLVTTDRRSHHIYYSLARPEATHVATTILNFIN